MTLGYLYDTSVFPSLMFYPMIGKIAVNHVNKPARLKRVISRRDWRYPLLRPIKPYMANADYKPAKPGERAIAVLPLPTLGRLYPPYWHTLGFIFGWRRAFSILRKILSRDELFYYLCHPADFAAKADLPDGVGHSLERMSPPIAEKLGYFERAFTLLRETGRPFATMSALAESVATAPGRVDKAS